MRKPTRRDPPASGAEPSPGPFRRARTSANPGAPRRRSDGERSHREILRAAADLASVEGLEGLSLAALAEHVGLSKSGLFAHFRSKEQLQLETIGLAAEIFEEEILRPAMAAPPGLGRLRTLVARFLEHVRRRTFPGGCFFASVGAEVDGHPGVLRDRIAAMQREWSSLFERAVVDAQACGEIDPETEAGQVAFEVLSMLAGAHGTFLLQGDAAILERASRGVESVLAAHRGAPRAAGG